MRPSRLAALPCAVLLAVSMARPAEADGEKSAPPAPKDIVVTGQAQSRAAVDKQASAITQNVGDQYKVPLAQFQEPVCPGVVGLPKDVAEVMVGRIRSNAQAIGIDVAREDNCRPNILLFVVANGQRTIKELQAKRTDLFRSMPARDLSRMAADAGPVHAWVNTVARSRHGDKLRGDDDSDLTIAPTLYVANSHSHIWMASRLDIISAIIIFDFKAIYGMSAVQLADYATMRTFAQTRPVAGDAAVATILSLFDPDSARPTEMTDFDLAYLRAIYHSAPNINAASKLGHINGELRQQRAENASGK